MANKQQPSPSVIYCKCGRVEQPTELGGIAECSICRQHRNRRGHTNNERTLHQRLADVGVEFKDEGVVHEKWQYGKTVESTPSSS